MQIRSYLLSRITRDRRGQIRSLKIKAIHQIKNLLKSYCVLVTRWFLTMRQLTSFNLTQRLLWIMTVNTCKEPSILLVGTQRLIWLREWQWLFNRLIWPISKRELTKMKITRWEAYFQMISSLKISCLVLKTAYQIWSQKPEERLSNTSRKNLKITLRFKIVTLAKLSLCWLNRSRWWCNRNLIFMKISVKKINQSD